jgi:D-arabinose 1-dehydrogenase-like Zn-dependent alcohol dehydrogenase
VYTREELKQVLALAARGMIKPLVAHTFPLAETRAAMERMESRDFFGKIVVLP